MGEDVGRGRQGCQPGQPHAGRHAEELYHDYSKGELERERERARPAAFERARERGGWTELERIFRMLVPIMSETGGEHMPGRRRRGFGGSRWVVESAAGPLVSL